MLEVRIGSIKCPADANRTIVITKIEPKDVNKKVFVITKGTEIPVLVIELTPSDLEVFIIKPSRLNKPEEIYSSRSFDYFPNVFRNILLLHLITGCDTTVSATYFEEKTKFFKTFLNNPD